MMVKIIVFSALLLLQIGNLFAIANNDSIFFNEKMQAITGSKGVLRFKEENIERIEEVVICNQEENINIRFSFKNNYFMILDSIYNLYKTPKSKKSYDFEHSCYFSPMSFNIEPMLILFECKEDIGKFWKVYLNNKKSKIGLIKKTDLFYFENWYQHFMWSMVNLKTNNIIKKEPIDSSVTIELNNDESVFVITEIKGEWIKIECLKELHPCNVDQVSGWTKWIDRNKVIIELAFFP